VSSKSNFKINKIDAIIVVALIVIAGVVLTKAGYISPTQEKIPTSQPDDPLPLPPPPTPPISLSSEYIGFMRAGSPAAAGDPFDPDGGNVKYGWDWNGNGIVDEWTVN